MNAKTIAECMDTYKWHVDECRRMLWTFKPGSNDAIAIKSSCDKLSQMILKWGEIQEEDNEIQEKYIKARELARVL